MTTSRPMGAPTGATLPEEPERSADRPDAPTRAAEHRAPARMTAAVMVLGAATQVPLEYLHPHQAQPNES